MLLSLNFVWVRAWDCAVRTGITEKEAVSIYQKYFQKAASMRSVKNLIDCHVRVLSKYEEAVRRKKKHPGYSSLVQKVCRYVEEHVCEQMQVQKISRDLQTNASYLSHLFKSETGVSLTSYIQMKKLDAAKLLLLQSESSVTGIMEQLGYISQSHFTTVFRNYTGMTPGQYKREAKEGRTEKKI